ncbi:hypothetical protein CE91St41_26330 [Oscillospiraceae bacterium]|nr:hypothetical protein CE91St40_11210 [Oscillospiraceae bacterium]BDF75744.1 hypothetical protein CE91St41_26330 [Oscillospiraceae bacterium]
MCCNCNHSCWDSCGCGCGCGCGVSASTGSGCGCGCGGSAGTGVGSGSCGCNGGSATLPLYPDQGSSGYYPVYISVPTFLRRPVAASEVVSDMNWGCLN